MCFFGKPAQPEIKAAPEITAPPKPSPLPAPVPTETASTTTAEGRRKRIRQIRYGMLSTIRTSPAGVTGDLTSGIGKQTLGA